jgi:hypothetical protein
MGFTVEVIQSGAVTASIASPDPPVVVEILTPQVVAVDIDSSGLIARMNDVLTQLAELSAGGIAGSGLSWTITGADTEMAVNYGYVCNSFSLQRMKLPAVAVVGDRVVVMSGSPTLFRVEQREGQSILFGDIPTTVGITGRIDSLHPGAGIELTFVGSSRWAVKDSNGNFEVT